MQEGVDYLSDALGDLVSTGTVSWFTTPGEVMPDTSFNKDFVWIVAVGFVIAFILAFAVGANDVANSFGTSVGSKVLTLRQACILAVIFETLGACLLGGQVSDTIWKEIVDVKMYEGDERTLLIGEVAALMGTAIWLLLATLLKVPVSGSHAVVGATMGFSFVKYGYHGIKWLRIVRIVASWFVSPVLAGALSGFLFILVRRFILMSPTPMESGLRGLPVFYSVSIFINSLSIFLGGAIQQIPWWGALIISVGLAVITGLVVHYCVVPWKRRTILENIGRLKAKTAIPLICGMNVSTATSLNMLDDDWVGRGPPVPLFHVQNFSTSTTSLNMLGDADKIAEDDLRDDDLPSADSQQHEVAQQREVLYLPLKYDHEEERQAPMRKKSVHTYKLAGGTPGQYHSPEFSVGNNMADDDSIQEVRDNGYTNGELEHVKHRRQSRIEVPRKKRNLSNWWSSTKTAVLGSDRGPSLAAPEDPPEIAAIFSFLQILTATFTSFAHGANDVSNAIGPLVAVWVIFSAGYVPQESSTPVWLLLFGGFGISVGLCVLGRKVIETVGTGLAIIIPSSGFCIGLGTASTVLLCSKIGLPVSTTHCIVGSVVAVGWLRSRKAVNWKVFGNIMACALMTVPIAAGVGAGCMALLSLIP